MLLWRLYKQGPVRQRKPERKTKKGRYTGVVSPATSRAAADWGTHTFPRSSRSEVTRRAWDSVRGTLLASLPAAAPTEGPPHVVLRSGQAASLMDRPRAVCHGVAQSPAE